MDGEWGDYIALRGLVNMLDIPAAVVSILGKEDLNIIYPTVSHGEEDSHFDSIALLGHEAESHFHSLWQMDKEAAKKPEEVQELNFKYGERRITEDEICPKCGKKFQCYFHGVFKGENGLLQVCADDSIFCDDCVGESD